MILFSILQDRNVIRTLEHEVDTTLGSLHPSEFSRRAREKRTIHSVSEHLVAEERPNPILGPHHDAFYHHSFPGVFQNDDVNELSHQPHQALEDATWAVLLSSLITVLSQPPVLGTHKLKSLINCHCFLHQFSNQMAKEFIFQAILCMIPLV